MITRQSIADQLLNYLNHRIVLAALVDWAERSIMEGDVEEVYTKTIMQSLGRIAAADVKNFGLLWEDCESIMKSLGFTIRVDVDIAA